MSFAKDIIDWRNTKQERGRNPDNYHKVGYGYYSKRNDGEASMAMRDGKRKVLEAIHTTSGMGHFGRDFIFHWFKDAAIDRRLSRKDQLKRKLEIIRTMRLGYNVPAVFRNADETFPRDPYTKYVGPEAFLEHKLSFTYKVTVLMSTGRFLTLISRENKFKHRDLWSGYPVGDSLETSSEPVAHVLEFMHASDMVECRMRNEMTIIRPMFFN